MLVSVSSQVGPRLVSFFNSLMFRIMCVRYLIAVWEKDSISFWILELGICRSWRTLTVVVSKLPRIPAMIIMGGSTIHPSWDKSGWRMACLSSFWLVASTWNLLLQ